jgi:exosome complex component RRP4
MPITILNPHPVAQPSFSTAVARRNADSDSDSEAGGVDLQGDVNMAHQDDEESTEVLTPGTVITSDPKWMRQVPPSLLLT